MIWSVVLASSTWRRICAYSAAVLASSIASRENGVSGFSKTAYQLEEQLQSLALQVPGLVSEARDVSARPAKALNNSRTQ